VSVPTLRYTNLDEALHQHLPLPGHLDLCARWLLQYLAEAGAPVRPADVVQAAGQAGFSRATLYRARQTFQDSIVDLGNSPYDPHKRSALAAASPSPPLSGGTPSPEGPPPGQHTLR
jgi:hypothetical protein